MPNGLTHPEKVAQVTRALGPPVGGPAVPTSPDGGPAHAYAAPGPPTDAAVRDAVRPLLAAIVRAVAGGGSPEDVGAVLRTHLPPLVAQIGLEATISVLEALPAVIRAIPATGQSG